MLWYYYSKPINYAFHDLTVNKVVPPAAAQLLGLSKKFVEIPRRTASAKAIDISYERLERSIGLLSYFAGDEDQPTPSKLRLKSTFRPCPSFEICDRLGTFEKKLQELFSKPSRIHSNLLPFQRQLLDELRHHPTVMIVDSDKGLGPVAVEYNRYVLDALKHLNDPKTYQRLTDAEATAAKTHNFNAVWDWTNKHRRVLSDDNVNYIRDALKNNDDPFGYFYTLYKLHKNPVSTRPVNSDCNSLLFPLGKWVDEQLQPVAQAQLTWFRDSFYLKKCLDKRTVQPNMSLFTYDAVSMYTNIDTDACIDIMSKYLRDNASRFTYDAEALIDAIVIVMRNNICNFGDIIQRQIKGIAMGMPPAPDIANVFVGIQEDWLVPKWKAICVPFLNRFIDDGFGVWVHNADADEDLRLWNQFKDDVNSHHGLEWEFSDLSDEVVFLDMRISIKNGKYETSLFAKPLALHLYLPPHSAHPPGCTVGLVMGNVLRIYQLCSREQDVERELRVFYQRLRDRGHQDSSLLPLFKKAVANAIDYINTPDEVRQRKRLEEEAEAKRRVFLHLRYHPAQPSSREIQQLWHETVFHPSGRKPLNHLNAGHGVKVPIDKLVIAYSRAPNLGNRFSYRKICTRKGPKVSSFLG